MKKQHKFTLYLHTHTHTTKKHTVLTRTAVVYKQILTGKMFPVEV